LNDFSFFGPSATSFGTAVALSFGVAAAATWGVFFPPALAAIAARISSNLVRFLPVDIFNLSY
jgi:hypothetical protein